MKKHLLVVGIIFLFLVSAFVPISTGFIVKTSDDQIIVEDYNRHIYPEYYDVYSVDEIPENTNSYSDEVVQYISNSKVIDLKEPLDGPMDSAWSMYCHDVRHTGRSPYSTVNNNGIEKWRFWIELSGIFSGIAISDDGTIFFSGAYDICAIDSNGTLKWRYDPGGTIESCPAIDENGIIYVGTAWNIFNGNNLFALYPNGTLKWKFFTGDNIFSSPAISDDGTIYFGCDNKNIYALYPNGTLKWKYTTGDYVLSSPAIGDDGTIYCGSHDTYLYALNPNNGSLKWRYKTGHWIRVSPCIGDDGTIYCVSLDNYLHAVYPNNGTRIWRTNVGAGTSPTIGQDGTIYCGYSKLYAVNPTDGSIKWSFDVQGKIRGATPCNSIDGTIYLGNSDGSDIVAVNPNGTEKWRKTLYGDIESAPAIASNGTVYIGSQKTNGGYLHAFGYPGPNPLKPTISGPNNGKTNTPYTYTFTSLDPDEDQVSYYIEWDDGNITDWTSFQPSGEPYTESHIWTEKDTYTIRAKAKDTFGLESDWGTLTVTMPKDKSTNNVLFRLVERFPLLQKIFLFIK
jgi:outer membrane protein assembly factor BamB